MIYFDSAATTLQKPAAVPAAVARAVASRKNRDVIPERSRARLIRWA